MEKKFESKYCPRCGQLFDCTPGVYCWCYDLSVSEQVKEWISSNFKGCLCRSCIDELMKSTSPVKTDLEN